MSDPTGRKAVAAVWRIDSARIIGALTRYTGDFALAEDLAQEALAEALVTWPREGVPNNPAGWLLTVGRRRAIDAFRRRSTRDEKYAVLARNLGEGGALTGATDPAAPDDVLWDPDQIDDDTLALVFTSCHPVLSREAGVALTLRVIGGLTSDEIARAFLVPTATVQARITRAKKTLGAANVPFEVPPVRERPARLAQVLSVIYLIFTEGSSASSGDEVMRLDLAGEAQRLARILSRLMPEEPEVHSLLALLELTAARFPARRGPDGETVLLEDQDRRRWDRSAIARGRAALAKAADAGRGYGYYGLQAAIAECHALAPSVERDQLGAHRAALRGARPARAVPGRRAQPRGRRLHGLGPRRRPADRRRARRAGRVRGLAPTPRRARRTAAPARPHRRGACRAGGGDPLVRQRTRA